MRHRDWRRPECEGRFANPAAGLTLSAQAEITEHEKNDHDGADEPDDLVHFEVPWVAQVGDERARPARIGTTPQEAI